VSNRKAPAKFPLLVLRDRLWTAKLRVPPDVKATLGKSVFSLSTGETDPVRAMVKAQPFIDKWKQQIEDVRAGKGIALQQHIEIAKKQLALITRLAQEEGEDGEKWERLSKLMAATREEDYHDERDRKPDPKALAIIEQALGEKTPFGARIDAWEGQLGLSQRDASMYASDVKAFAKAHPLETVEGLTGATVQVWMESLDIAPKTINRKLSSLRNYWGWLQAHEVAQVTNKPFHGRKLPKGKHDAVKRQAFQTADIPRLIAKAHEDRDGALADLITLAAYTGARIEELCNLKVGHVDNGIISIPGTKTDAALRKVPAHTALGDLLVRLVVDSKDGYLIPVATANRYDERSAPIGKRFGRMKAEMGFGPEHVFHSLRKTVATLLEDAQCPEGIAADIIGHDKPTMTYGLYSGGSSLATRREWIEKAIHY
jgi:integrase